MWHTYVPDMVNIETHSATAAFWADIVTISILQMRKPRHKGLSNLPKVTQVARGGAKIQRQSG